MKSTIYVFLLCAITETCLSQDYSAIDDIPIESYNHRDHQENDMDMELLPVRRGKSFPSEDDSRDYFFRSPRSFDDLGDVQIFGAYENIPRSTFRSSDQLHDRAKRNALVDSPDQYKRDKTFDGIVKSFGEPLEVVPLDAQNLTERENRVENRMDNGDEDGKQTEINDFIRFRRSVSEDPQKSSGAQERDQKQLQPLFEKLRSESSEENVKRQSRGATEDHWVKQMYPVKKSDEIYFDDSVPSATENMRVPRVHFVTQNIPDNGIAFSVLRPNERDPRSRNFDRKPRRDLVREFGWENSFHEKIPRSDVPLVDRYRGYYRDEPYARYDSRDYNDVYRPRYESYDTMNSNYNSPVQKPQKRIIYYATLPEISRNPPHTDLRDRYRYNRDRYGDRYLSDPYRYRKSYPKSRYEDEGKTPYPVKVLTDVNVREVKKSPERRIYSEVDGTRYAYNTPPYRASDL